MKLYVIGRPNFDEKALIAFLRGQQTSWKRTRGVTQAEELVEVSGRICYMSFGNMQSPRSNKEYIRNLIKMGHESVLEHVSWTFILAGVSRAFTHQLVRHRVGFSFSQLSQQYHDETNAELVEPQILKLSKTAKQAWLNATKASTAAYKAIIQSLEDETSVLSKGLTKKEYARLIRSAARSVMPNATETKIGVTANARALRHFLRVRGTIPGDEEMRFAAALILKTISKEAPSLFDDFSIQKMSDGSPIIVHE